MNNKRKYFSLAVCLILISALLIGCQQTTGQEDVNQSTSVESVDNENIDYDNLDESVDIEEISNTTVDVSTNTNVDPSVEYAYRESVFDLSVTKGSFACYYFRSNYTRPRPVGNFYSGDAALLVAPDGTTMLIDFNMAPVTSHVVDSLQRLGISELDYVMASHTDEDHCGGYKTLLSNIKVGHVYVSDDPYYKSTEYKAGRFLAMAVEQGASYSILKGGMEVDFGGVTMKVYSPTADYEWPASPTSAQRNDASLVVKFVYGESSFLFAGDINSAKEIQLTEMYGEELQADVVKMDHHGLKSSNSKKWYETIQPKLACGMAAVVHSSEVLERFMIMDIPFTLSVLDGATVVWTDGDGVYDVQVEKDREDSYFGVLPTTDGHFQIK